MIGILAAGLLWSTQAGYTASFADAWDRWKQVDALWPLAETQPRRILALPHLKMASQLLYGSRWREACLQLDEALADLQGHKIYPEQSVVLRFRPPVVEPGKSARMQVTWAYEPADRRSIELRFSNRRVTLNPGRTLTLEIVPERVEPELSRNPELGVPITVDVGRISKTIFLSVLKSARVRIGALLSSGNEAVRNLGQRALTLFETGQPTEPGSSLLAVVMLAESLEKGNASLPSIPFALQGRTNLQAALPAGKDSMTVVIALSGFAGEQAYFSNFGQGLAPSEAQKRGWGFVGASLSISAVADVLLWLTKGLGKKVERYFVMGYGKASGESMASLSLKARPAAAALFAPVDTEIPTNRLSGPMFLSVGKQDSVSVIRPVEDLVTELGERKDVWLFEPAESEHLMLPQESIRQAFEFFDVFAKHS